MALPATMSALAAQVGCTRYPVRWDELYKDLLTDLARSGNPYTDPGYYARLHAEYGILPNYLQLYQGAALAIGQDPELSAFLYILCRMLEQSENHRADMADFTWPVFDGDFAKNMLCGLAAASETVLCYNKLIKRNLPEHVMKQVLQAPEFGITFFKLRHNGEPGYNLLYWYQLAIDCKLFRIGRLEYELFAKFAGHACIFENSEGSRATLAQELDLHVSGHAYGSPGYEDTDGRWTATITETDEHWIGHPFNEDGSVSHEAIQLSKSDWKKIISYGDPVISVHIPAGGGLTEEAVERSLTDAKAFFAQYFPDYDYRCFVCYSWLMDPQLVTMLGRDCNIAKFNLRFTKLTQKSSGTGVFTFVFLKPDTSFDLQTLPENTKLEQELKAHYLSGKYIYELMGYFT